MILVSYMLRHKGFSDWIFFWELSCVISSLLPCTRRNDETKTPKGVKLV